MAYPLPHPPPFLLSRIFHGHLGIKPETATIPSSISYPLLLNQLIANIKTETSGTKESADTTANTLGGDFLPIILVAEASL
jgi:hypothetical protein